MINIIVILLLIHYIGLILFKPKHNILGCGIFAWSGSNAKLFNKAKFDILGLYNNSRGGDSCGVTTDGEIYYGLQGSKNYYDFIIEKDYLTPKVIPVVFGHTRKSSHGVINENNAHPFGFGSLKEGYSFIGCHNGTLYNHADLAKENNIETDIWKQNEDGTRGGFERMKIDSEILLECIYRSKDIKVLDNYIGGAALLFQDLTEPDVIYAYHGASRKETTDKNTEKFEERPLYYYREGKNSLYISSLEEPLIAIGGISNETVFEFKHNVVYKIKKGNIDSAVTYKVNRNEAAHRKGYDYKNFTKVPATSKTFMGAARASQIATQVGTNTTKRGTRSKTKFKVLDNSIINNIYDETDDKYYKSGINFVNLRYKRNGHPINGVFTFIPSFGFFFLAEDSTKAMAASYELMNKHFDLEKERFLHNHEIPDFKSGNLITPFSYTKQIEPTLLYFYQGIMLETVTDYEAVNHKFKEKFSFHDLSHMSKHPIIDITKKRLPDVNQGITKNGKLYSKKHSFLQSGKIYNIENGNLVNIEICENSIDLNTESNPIILGPSSSPIVIPINTCNTDDSFEKHQEEELGKLSKLFEIQPTIIEHFIDTNDIFDDTQVIELNAEIINEDPVLVEKINKIEQVIIEKEIMPIYQKVQEANNVLSKLDKSESTDEIIEINKDYLMNLNSIVLDKNANHE